MKKKLNEITRKLMEERFGHDSLIALATVDDQFPTVRTVNSYYENGCFYIITYLLSGKMQQLQKNPNAAICGDWFTAHGIGENLGWVRSADNMEMMEKLRTVFASWYNNGHTNENDPNTVLLRIRLTDGVLFSHGTRYEIDFSREEK